MAVSPLCVSVLKDRGVVAVSGPDAEKLLGGLVTNDMATLGVTGALYAGLLMPQGKMLFDFLIVRSKDGFLLDTLRQRAGDLVKRLSMYKLRASVEIKDVSADFTVLALWGGTAVPPGTGEAGIAFPDPRLAALGSRILAGVKAAGEVAADDAFAATGAAVVPDHAYHAHRIGLGVPEGGRDFAFGDTFPHEALLDQLNGVSFTKGCYVGQEIVSRMQHRASIRKRVVPVVADEDLPPGPLPVLAGEAEIGRLGSTAGPRGLALLRIDRAAEARRVGIALTIGGRPVTVEAPPFATFEIGGAP